MPDPPYFVHPRGLCESREVGPGTRIWAFAHVMRGATVGARCNVGDHAFVESGAVVGDDVTIKNGVSVWRGVTVHDGAFLGPNCTFTNDLRPRSRLPKAPEDLAATTVGRHATVGANATVVCGLEIGPGAFVAAGAVVVRDVPAYALVAGNPARRRGWVCECGERLVARSGVMVCRCGRRYELLGVREGLRPLADV